MNYLSPSVKRDRFTEDEDDLIIRLHNLLGNRWALIAGRVPERTDNQVKNHWNTHLSKKILSKRFDINNEPFHMNLKTCCSSNFCNVEGEETKEKTTGKMSSDEGGDEVLAEEGVDDRDGGEQGGSCLMQYLDDYTLHFVLSSNKKNVAAAGV